MKRLLIASAMPVVYSGAVSGHIAYNAAASHKPVCRGKLEALRGLLPIERLVSCHTQQSECGTESRQTALADLLDSIS
jgi:hypothetical protein